MSLKGEWRKRIEHWQRKLQEMWYRPLGVVDMTGFVTCEQLTAAQAGAADFGPMPPGTQWGGKWDYAWFRGEAPGQAMPSTSWSRPTPTTGRESVPSDPSSTASRAYQSPRPPSRP